MRVYSRTAASSVHHDEHGTYDIDPDTGLVEVPDELGELLMRQHVAGERAWENDAERHKRLADEEAARRRDPGALYDLLSEQLGKMQQDPEALVAAFADFLARSQGDGKHESLDDETPKRRTRKAAEPADTDPPAE